VAGASNDIMLAINVSIVLKEASCERSPSLYESFNRRKWSYHCWDCTSIDNLVENWHVNGQHSSQHCCFRFLLAALHAAQSAGIQISQRAILRFFAPQGRHVSPIGVKFGTEESRRSGPKVHIGATTGVWLPKMKILLKFDQTSEYKRPTGAYP